MGQEVDKTGTVEESDEPVDDQGDTELQPTTLVGWMELSGSIQDGPPPFSWVGPDQGPLSLRHILKQLERVAKEDYLGVVIYLNDPELTLSQVQELSAAIRQVRKADRKVLVFADHYTMRTYVLACAADKILLQNKGVIELMGIGVEEIYLAGLLEKVGAKADFIQVGRFKGAEEPLTRTGPSEAWNENIGALLDDLYDLLRIQISRGRRVSAQEVEGWLADCWSMTDEQYVERGLVDQLTSRDLVEATSQEFGEDFDWDVLLESGAAAQAVENPFALFRLMFQEPRTRVTRPSLALVHAYGSIHGGEGGGNGPFDNKMISSRELQKTLNEARGNELIRGVVLRIDSPGGSALASELIWQAVRELAQVKPVFVSVGTLAASGGYYIACAGDQIYVSPGTVLGSIGVVGGKIVLGPLYEKIGISVHRRSRGPHGDMFNSVEGFTPEQRTALQGAFEHIYAQFTDRVVIGRGQRIGDIDKVAQGRLFTGRQAVKLGLADRIGGVDEALADLAKQVGLEEGQYDVVNLPPPKNLSEFLEDMFSVSSNRLGFLDAVTAGLARRALGPEGWRAAGPVLTGLMLLEREPVLTLMPSVILVR